MFNAAATQAQYMSAASAIEPLSIAVTLKLNNRTALDTLIAAQHTPGNSSYHKWLTNEQSRDAFSPTADQAQAVADYLTRNGFINVQISSSRMLITATGTAGTAQQAFNTALGAYAKSDGNRGIAPLNQVQVPAGLSQIDQVLGLNTMANPHVHSLSGSVLPARITSSLGTGGTNGYYPDGFATVYSRPSNRTASGTVVAVVGWGDMTGSVSDLKQFESARGIAAVPTSILPAANQRSTDTTGRIEWSLDSQAVVGISGGVKQLLFYTTGGTYSANSGSSGSAWASLATLIDQVVTDNTAKVINMSWGTGECGGKDTFLDSAFARGVTQGQTFSASSGDNGAYPCAASENGVYGNKKLLSVEYPASSPYVIAVGGTTLNSDSSLNYKSESAWAYSGGGISDAEAQPSWESSLSASYRQVPDVAFDADPTTGTILYFNGAVYSQVGGTSLASPLFVGAWAVLESANNNSLGFAPQLIYSNIGQLNNASAIHDVTSGNNGYYSTQSGYDDVTGWGSFNITNLLASFGGQPSYTYTVTASAGAGGAISPSGTVSVTSGATPAFAVTPNAGYAVSNVGGTCGGTLNGTTYTTTAIAANCTVAATFVAQTSTHVVTASAGSNGSISPSGYLTVKSGQTQAFKVTPNSGYTASVGGTCGGTLNGNTYTTKAITANCTVAATFTQSSTRSTRLR
jgi:subtilase family serine protease